ncbi:MAG TPA: GH3 auxin-responsive promoter family protein, partial [Mucilaginibacter sp.]|nr:GH3 auxin-responsive promoter family protein [Mucilaginibacter sp.]
MGLKAALSRVFAAWVNRDLSRTRTNSVTLQQKTFQYLIQSAKDTAFGKDHHFESIHNYDNFKKLVPIRDYEDLRPYIDRVTHGEENILWPGKPEYLAKTSGTTSGVKYIPITKESMPEHIKAARNALLNYIHE